MSLKLSTFDYSLPEHLVAQYPHQKRDEARLLVVDRKSKTISHDIFKNVGKYLPPKSLIVVNNSKVIFARLLGHKLRTGGQVEVFLLKQLDDYHFAAMIKPLKKVQEGEPLDFGKGVSCSLVDREKRIVRFEKKNILKVLEDVGHIPLPPYIKRSDEEFDRIMYQTVYAKKMGSVAAPTAGLHFTKPLIKSLKTQGHSFAEVTLHVNYGTFKPVEVEQIDQHPMHFEQYSIGNKDLAKVNAAKVENGPVFAVGTTSCRTLESYARTGKNEDNTNLFIYPGKKFKYVNGLITNFHLPKSTLFMLVSAFAGTKFMQKAYQEAINKEYSFYSYGDAMIIL